MLVIIASKTNPLGLQILFRLSNARRKVPVKKMKKSCFN